MHPCGGCSINTIVPIRDNVVDRTAVVTIWATGVPVQTISVTQSKEMPALNFSSSNTNGSLSIYLQFNLGVTFYIDWGDSVQVAQTSSMAGQTYSTTSYHVGDIVKIYQETVKLQV